MAYGCERTVTVLELGGFDQGRGPSSRPRAIVWCARPASGPLVSQILPEKASRTLRTTFGRSRDRVRLTYLPHRHSLAGIGHPLVARESDQLIRLSTGAPLTLPSPAVRNHRNAVRLALESVSALNRIPQTVGTKSSVDHTASPMPEIHRPERLATRAASSRNGRAASSRNPGRHYRRGGPGRQRQRCGLASPDRGRRPKSAARGEFRPRRAEDDRGARSRWTNRRRCQSLYRRARRPTCLDLGNRAADRMFRRRHDSLQPVEFIPFLTGQ